jgi:hypothetical protein
MKLPIDTNAITFLTAGPREATLDFDTRTPGVSKSGEPIFAVQVVALSEGGAEVISIKVAGEPKGVGQGDSSQARRSRRPAVRHG